MAVEIFEDNKNFPFDEYYKSLEQYVSAQSYWLCVLKEAKGFVEGDWNPYLRPVDVEADQVAGLMYRILNKSSNKEINIFTRSYDGIINEVMQDNTGMSEVDVDEAVEKWNFTPTEPEIRGYSWKDAEKEVQTFYKNSLIWVEPGYYFKDIPSHPEGGEFIPVEILVLNSEISVDAESKARQALELFLQDGPAMERVNSVFSPDEDD